MLETIEGLPPPPTVPVPRPMKISLRTESLATDNVVRVNFVGKKKWKS